MKKTTFIGIKILKYSLGTFMALFLLGLVCGWGFIFLANCYDRKFGPWGTFQIYTIISILLAGTGAGIFLIVQTVWALLNREFYATGALRCVMLLFAMVPLVPFTFENKMMWLTFLLFYPVASSALMIIYRIKRK